MILSIETIEKILIYLNIILNNKFVITGSIADFFNIGYDQIHDIDIFMDSQDYLDQKSNINSSDSMKYMKSMIGIKTNKGTALHKYYYKNICGIDITVVNKEYGWRFGNIRKTILSDQDISLVEINNVKYKIFSPIARINQLSKHNYTKKHSDYINKVKRAILRVEIYKEKFGVDEA